MAQQFNSHVVSVSQQLSPSNHQVTLFIHFLVLTAPHMEHGTQWAGRGQSSARMLPANLLTPASTHSPSSVFSSFFPFLHPHHQREQVHPQVHARFELAVGLFWKLLLEAHFQLTVLWPQSRTFAPFESGLSVHRHTEPNLGHWGWGLYSPTCPGHSWRHWGVLAWHIQS